ncbi:MAG: hypothetical protein A2913_01135 [Parcubacteria group bacterium RIFCSPLOWO2_01_FULL_40_65]|nr:MAG: hypothetical protein A2734_00780 [Parcubacteria group bacterium RIFCSPHIGHO2_01_FULL_40_30]OHB19488.1 MAG: hypothetical protein A3D40_02500 [Parcubacteria group bacterium RIFCSPHIGHO2_02_FULL_40_12]OHB22091.1 MAG: hypothetical protein A2913_01135 [Parcubacteria group bacterium RIFCSPLOWO2_01_FULL_40_65]OHB23686.1 MAG: hypothetical protein A3I22_02535 [Parcubacteria group bacterium RIFCSPLOWO2_02_FULL_40_12]OHB24383.1 MAG: hypothetical protein A3F96_00725 [Parcubacteria group bacterium R
MQSGYISLRHLKIQGRERENGAIVDVLMGKKCVTFGILLVVKTTDEKIFSASLDSIELDVQAKIQVENVLSPVVMAPITSTPANSRYERSY